VPTFYSNSIIQEFQADLVALSSLIVVGTVGRKAQERQERQTDRNDTSYMSKLRYKSRPFPIFENVDLKAFLSQLPGVKQYKSRVRAAVVGGEAVRSIARGGNGRQGHPASQVASSR
jgi:hypothetical protein